MNAPSLPSEVEAPLRNPSLILEEEGVGWADGLEVGEVRIILLIPHALSPA